jgi:hypothetical protein
LKIELGPLESVYWHSRPAYKLRYPLLTLLLFLGTFLVVLGSFWEDIGTISFLVSFIFLALSIWGAISRERVNYYLTNTRLVSPTGQIELGELTNVGIRQSFLNSWRNLGDLSFETAAGSWLLFKRIKDPESVKTHVLKIRDAAKGNAKAPPLSPDIETPQIQEQTLAPVTQSETSKPRLGAVWFRRHRKWLFVSIFLIVLLGGLAAFLSICPDIQIANSTFLVRPGDYVPYSFTETRSGNHIVWGGFSSNSTISMYLMSSNQFASFSSSGVVSSYLYTSGQTTSYSVPTQPCYTKGCTPQSTVIVQQGVYYVVFSNLNNPGWAKVSITSPMLAETC